jgi:hypothetical protein
MIRSLIFFVALASSMCHAQSFSKITGLEIEYWRAQHIAIDKEMNLTLFTTIKKGISSEQREKNQATREDKITREDIQEIVDFFNSSEARQYFLELKHNENMLDGSAASITLRQNGFSQTFSLQTPFEEDSPPLTRKFADLLYKMITLAKLDWKRDTLY